MEITIQIRPPLILPPWERAQTAIQKLLNDAGRPDAEISVVLTNDAEIRELNRQWRNRDKATDVLSWPLEETMGEPLPGMPDALGDVVISLDTAARQAAARDWELADETALLMVHGILHLLGHEDETEEGSNAMKRIEERLLGKPLEKIEIRVQ